MIKRLSIIFCAVLMLAAAVVPAAAEGRSYIRGDADGDGDVAIPDVTFVQRYIADIRVPFFDELAADVNSDGLDITDATLIQRYLANVRTNCNIGELVIIPSETTVYPTDPNELPIIYA